MNKLACGLVISCLLTSVSAWAQTNPASTPQVDAPPPVATPKPLPPDEKAARDKWLNAKAQEVQAEHDYNAVKLKHQVDNSQKCVNDAQAKNDTTKAAKYQAKLTVLDKIKTDQDQILTLKLDQINSEKADNKTDAQSDSDQIKSLQDDIKAQWQSMK